LPVGKELASAREEFKVAFKKRAFFEKDKECVAFYLLKSQRLDLLKLMIEAEGLSPDRISMDGTPLLVACARQKENDFISYLLAKGANPNLKDQKNLENTALHVAVIEENEPLVASLLKNQRN